MGIHANSTCVMNYDGATGWLVGDENKGLAAMFIMMNAARLGVGIQGLGQADIAFQNAVQYAQDRRQGRALTGPQDPEAKADPLFVHPDVRRMLMDGKAVGEGLRALCLWGALQVDLAHLAETEEERQRADDLVSLLTPVIKGFGTDKGYEVATNAQQVFGRSEEHTSELQSLMRISYAVFCLKKTRKRSKKTVTHKIDNQR